MTEKGGVIRVAPKRRPDGIPAEAIAGFLEELSVQKYRLHGLMIWHRGALRYADAAEPYTLQTPHRLFSAAKSILVLAALKAMEQGKLRPEDRVVSFFPEIPADDSLRNMTVEDLLTMRTGQEGDPFGLLFQDFDADLIRAFLSTPAEETPGTRFRYNNTVPHIICAVVCRAVGMPFPEYMGRYFSEPLEAPITAPTNPQGIYNPVVTTMSMESFFRYALLFLHGGSAGGRQLLPEAPVRAAMAEHTGTGLAGNSAGYGWQIWMNAFGGCRMDGGWGQYAFILPETDTCVAMLSDMTECGGAVTAFEQRLLPALRGDGVPEPQGEVQLASLAPAGSCVPDADIPGSAWTFPDGTVVTVECCPERAVIRMSGERTREAEIGLNGRFLPGRRCLSHPVFSIDQTVYGADAEEMLRSGAWSSPRCLEIRGKSFGEMGEYAARLCFERDRVTAWYHDTVQHGIADPLIGRRSEGVRQ